MDWRARALVLCRAVAVAARFLSKAYVYRVKSCHEQMRMAIPSPVVTTGVRGLENETRMDKS